MKSRNLQIDTVRGIACILLVAFHVVGVSPTAGLRIDVGIYRDLNDVLAYIRMPLFTFVSGIVYAYRPLRGGVGEFVVGKLRRLIVPMLVVGTLFAVVQAYTPGANARVSNWYLLHIDPVAHYWFIESIFLIFMVMIPLELMRLFERPLTYLLVLGAAILLFLSSLTWKYLGVSGALYLFPYFLMGMGLQRFDLIRRLGRVAGLVLLGLATIAVIMLLKETYSIEGKRTLPGLLIGASVCIGLLSMGFSSKILSMIGWYSYSIYLYHVFFTAGSRILFGVLGLNNIHVLFFMGLVTGVLGPILVELVFIRWSLTRKLFLGQKPRVAVM